MQIKRKQIFFSSQLECSNNSIYFTLVENERLSCRTVIFWEILTRRCIFCQKFLIDSYKITYFLLARFLQDNSGSWIFDDFARFWKKTIHMSESDRFLQDNHLVSTRERWKILMKRLICRRSKILTINGFKTLFMNQNSRKHILCSFWALLKYLFDEKFVRLQTQNFSGFVREKKLISSNRLSRKIVQPFGSVFQN